MGLGSQGGGQIGVARKRSLVVGASKWFLCALLLISSWQMLLYFGSYYYSAYQQSLGHHFNVTEYSLSLGQMVQLTRTAMIQQFDNLTASLIAVDQQLNQKQELLWQTLERNQEVIESKGKQNQQEISKAIDSIHNRLQTLEWSGSSLKGPLDDQKIQFQELSNHLEERLHSLETLTSKHLSSAVEFLPLKDMEKWAQHGRNGEHGFLSQILGRDRAEGPPELFTIPSNLTGGRLLCLKGNDTRNGSHNSYAYAFREGLPANAVLLPGTTLISDTYWDYTNPWHAMYNLIQFVHWKMTPICRSAQRLILFHWSELRTELGYWIKNVFDAASLPTEPETLGYGNRPVCFEDAVVARSGIGGVPAAMLKLIYREVRCTARRKCGVWDFRTGPSTDRKVRMTLMVRSGARGFGNLKDWQDVISSQCRAEKGCSWFTMFVSNLTFCQQVEVMSKTDILVTVHGAQMTNMVFMSPGSRVLEMFPRGWKEFAGHGQFVYSNLAAWVGLQHEGYWRDLNSPECPDPSSTEKCFSFYKDQPVGINFTHISSWMAKVIDNFNFVQEHALLPEKQQNRKYQLKWDNATCACSD